MLLFPNCKINIGLRVVAKRTDDYHDIETVMYPVRGLCDALEILPDATDDISFTSSGLETGVDPERNICVRAYRAFREACPIGGVRMHLHKTIPMGAGLGGGSADAAFTIKGLAELFGVPLTAEQMIRLAAQVGSDVPFFIDGRPTLATGRGEILAPVAGSPIGHRLVIVKPDESVSTAEAYAGVAPARPESRLGDLFGLPLRQWKGRIVNDFETSVFRIHPTIAAIKEELYRAGALYASMSGSGSAVYGIFEERTPDLPAFEGMFVYQEDMI